MNKTLKRTLCVLLSVIMLLGLCVPSFATLELNNYPTLHIHGRSTIIYDSNAKQIYTNPDPEFDEIEFAKSLVPGMIEELSKTLITQDWEGYSRYVCDQITPAFEMIQLDENGDPKDGTNGGGWKEGNPLSAQRDYYWVYYDWRVDPLETAETLRSYIKEIKRVNKCDKVNIDSRCLGSNLAVAYLYLEGENAANDVANLVLHVPSVDGSQTVGALFANQIYFDAKAVDEYVTYYMNGQNRIFDNEDYGLELETFIAAFSSFLYQVKVLGYGTDLVNDIYNKVKDYMVPRLATNVFFFPTYWAMIDDRYYEAAKETLFKENADGYYTLDKDEYAGYIEKIDNYHYNVQAKSHEILLAAKNSGINISVIAKYGENMLPVEKDARTQGDGRIETKSLSFGATCSNISDTLSESYIASHDSKYISADKKIDASTCLFPESTWFVRDLQHTNFVSSVETFKEYLIRGVEQPTIENMKDYGYEQFMAYSAEDGSITPVVGESPRDEDYNNDFISTLFRFLTAFLNFFAKIFKINR